MMGHLETLSSSQIIFIPLFSAHRCCTFYQQPQTVRLCWAKTFSSARPTYFTFSSSNFAVEGHILTTAGDALTKEHTALNFELTRCNGFWNLWELDCTMYIRLKSTHRSESMFCCIFTILTPRPPSTVQGNMQDGWCVNRKYFLMYSCPIAYHNGWLAMYQLSMGHSEPAQTIAPSTGCPLLLSCGWTSTESIFGFRLVTNSRRSRSQIQVDR
jgi:hypothetical protein